MKLDYNRANEQKEVTKEIIEKKEQVNREILVSPVKHRGILRSLCPVPVCPPSGSHSFLVVTLFLVTYSYVSQATHAFLEMLPF